MTLDDSDVKTIKDAFSEVFDEKVQELGLVTKEDISHLPSKEEYFNREDKMMAKLKKIEEELTVVTKQCSDHSDKIEKLEKMHPHGRHLAAI